MAVDALKPRQRAAGGVRQAPPGEREPAMLRRHLHRGH